MCFWAQPLLRKNKFHIHFVSENLKSCTPRLEIKNDFKNKEHSIRFFTSCLQWLNSWPLPNKMGSKRQLIFRLITWKSNPTQFHIPTNTPSQKRAIAGCQGILNYLEGHIFHLHGWTSMTTIILAVSSLRWIVPPFSFLAFFPTANSFYFKCKYNNNNNFPFSSDKIEKTGNLYIFHLR